MLQICEIAVILYSIYTYFLILFLEQNNIIKYCFENNNNKIWVTENSAEGQQTVFYFRPIFTNL